MSTQPNIIQQFDTLFIKGLLLQIDIRLSNNILIDDIVQEILEDPHYNEILQQKQLLKKMFQNHIYDLPNSYKESYTYILSKLI